MKEDAVVHVILDSISFPPQYDQWKHTTHDAHSGESATKNIVQYSTRAKDPSVYHSISTPKGKTTRFTLRGIWTHNVIPRKHQCWIILLYKSHKMQT